MKKILTVLLFLTLIMPAFSKDELTFIYLNGSNTNTEKTKEEFIKGVNNLHKQIMLNFNKSEFVNKKILNNGKYSINSIPISFYWGDLSRNDMEVIKEDFNFLRQFSPKPANYVRNFIAECLHDAIWVSRTENMYPIVNKLHGIIQEEYNKGNKVVLAGYSAGTFIVQNYVFIKMPIINIKESLMNESVNKEFRDYVKDKNLENTCLDAVVSAKLISFDLENNIEFEEGFDQFSEKIDKINDYTKMYCAKKDALKGAINYASPFALFYSDIFNPDFKMAQIMALSYKFIVENDMFWLTVNYSDDPLGFPVSRNAKFEEIETLTKLDINPNGGYIYDTSKKPSGRTFVMAHLAYFKTAKKYAKILTQAVQDGFNHFYMTNGK